jgi:hypothetical protein
MDERSTAHDGRMTAGRKGIPYDWQSVLAHRELESPFATSAAGAAGAATYPLGNR